MQKDRSSRAATERSQSDRSGSDNPLPDVPFMGIAAILGLLVLVLVGTAAYSISQTFDGLVLDSSLLAPAIFVLLVAALFWVGDRYDPRSHET